MDVHYRDVATLVNNYAVSAIFRGTPGEPAEIAAKLEESQQKRRSSQPKESSAGCIFKNPVTIPAGKLIDELGLKGARIGGARVSEIHGNFIVNDGGATAADVLGLIEQIKQRAMAERRIELHTEVQIVGEERGGGMTASVPAISTSKAIGLLPRSLYGAQPRHTRASHFLKNIA